MVIVVVLALHRRFTALEDFQNQTVKVVILSWHVNLVRSIIVDLLLTKTIDFWPYSS